MNKKIFIVCLTLIILSVTNTATAQVVVGKAGDPQKFSLLELIAVNRDRGMRLPQMTSTERDAMQATFGSLATTEAKGLMIYNTTIECVQTWNGETWISKCEEAPCTEPIISGATSLYIGNTITLSVTETGGTWASSNTAVATVSQSGVVTGIMAGTAYITYTANGCTSLPYNIAVLFSTTPYPTTPDNSVYMTGQMCFDTKETNDVDGGDGKNLSLTQRKSLNFTDIQSRTYELKPNSGTITSVDNWTVTPSNPNLIESYTISGTPSIGTKLTILWKDIATIRAAVPDSRRGQVYVDITAYLTMSGGAKKISTKRVYIQDYACCGAAISATVWAEFMCHNVGADESAYPFSPSYSLNGKYYQWGRIDPAKDGPSSAAGADASVIAWNSVTPSGWFGNNTNGTNVKIKSDYDPCPYGWRVPSFDELDYVQTNATRTNLPTTWTTSLTTANSWSLVKFGNFLFLPAAGYRHTGLDPSYTGGDLYRRGHSGYYWTTRNHSTDPDKAVNFGFNQTDKGMESNPRILGITIRCIAMWD
jgi:uncharacterized protein (TIGR02145 family)